VHYAMGDGGRVTMSSYCFSLLLFFINLYAMETKQSLPTDNRPEHNRQWLNHIHPAPVKRVSPVYDLINMGVFEIIYAIDEGRLSAQDKNVFATYIRKCKEYPEGHVKEHFRKETARLFPHFLK